MFEIDKYERGLHREKPSAPAEPYVPASDVAEMSLLFWSEHCVECAAPACYQSCDLYQPRPDKRCRRFTYGSFKNQSFPSLRGYGVEISFKKWAKLEAYANLSLYPVRSALMRERLTEWVAPVANVIGKIIGKLTRNDNWDSATYIAAEKIARRLDRGRNQNDLPTAFLLEVYNPGSETVRFQLNFKSGNEHGNGDFIQLEPSITVNVSFPSGYSRYELATDRLRPLISSNRPFKISLIPEADNNARVVFLTADFVKFKKKPISASRGKEIKCLVWDLDNTLWKGILIEGDAVTVGPGVVKLLEQLDERGILLSIVSKNDFKSAWDKVTQLGLSEYFLFPQINWLPKSANIKTIAERLNIGIDTLAFIDDNPFELDQVAQVLPEVTCINAEHVQSLLSDPRFEGSKSADARHRRRFYQEAIERETAQQEFGANYLGFLATCGIVLEISEYSAGDAERIAELVQRTNQLNFSGQKYVRRQLEEIVSDPRIEKYVLKSSDKYGSYGTVGFALVEHSPDAIEIREFMLSCRVQGKFIEQAFFSHIFEHHCSEHTTTLWVNFRPTERNKPAQQVLEALGFRKCDATSERFHAGMIHSSPRSLHCDFIRVQCKVVSAEADNAAEPSADHAESRR